jgi:RimJ/RimL family protein N-acetyltransferase
MTNIWQSKLVRLRAVEPEDWQAFFDWDQDTDFGRWTYWIPFPGSRESAKKWTADLALAGDKNHEFRWVIESLSGEFVGTLNTHTCDPRVGTFQYGIAVKREHWRNGYASEAIWLVLGYFFRELRYQKVNAHVYAFNEPSLELHRKLGFKEEGRLRRMVYTDGRHHDEVIFGMTVEEFEAGGPGESLP